MGLNRQRKELLLRLRETPIVFLGLGVYRAWIATALGNLALAGPVATLHGLNLYDLSLACTALLCAALARKIAPLSGKRSFLVLGAGLMCAGTLLGIAAHLLVEPPLALLPLASLLAGVGTAVLILLWAEFFASLNPMRVALYYSASLILGELIVFVLAGFRESYLLGFLVLLPIISTAMQTSSMNRIPVEDRPKAVWGKYSFPWKPVALMAVCAFAYGYGGTAVSSELKGPLSYLGIIAVASVIFIGTLSASKRFNFGFIYRIALPAMIIGFLLVAPSLEIGPGLSSACVSIGYIAFSVFIMLILSNIAYRFGISPVWLCGIERGVRYLFIALGRALQEIRGSGALPTDVEAAVNIAITIALVVVFALVFFSERELSAKWGLSLHSDAGAGTLETDRLAMRVSDLAKTYALSTREQEVLQLLAQRKTVARIERELFIANGTVKAHIRHIYSKLGIHSKDELHEMLGLAE